MYANTNGDFKVKPLLVYIKFHEPSLPLLLTKWPVKHYLEARLVSCSLSESMSSALRRRKHSLKVLLVTDNTHFLQALKMTYWRIISNLKSFTLNHYFIESSRWLKEQTLLSGHEKSFHILTYLRIIDKACDGSPRELEPLFLFGETSIWILGHDFEGSTHEQEKPVDEIKSLGKIMGL